MSSMNLPERVIVNNPVYNFFYVRTVFRDFMRFCDLKGKCLELGCGPGHTSMEIHKAFPVSLTSIDYDIDEVRIAKRTLRSVPIRVLQADARTLPFSDSSFDCVLEANAFHHIAQYKDAIADAYRVLKRGGSFYLLDTSKTFLWPLLCPFEHIEGRFTKESLMADLEDAGFGIIKHRGGGIFSIHAEK